MSYEVRSERATRARRRGVGEVCAVRSSLGCDVQMRCVYSICGAYGRGWSTLCFYIRGRGTARVLFEFAIS